jgi:GNAT superfamily N-acetyltransferase
MAGDHALPEGLRIRRYRAADNDQAWALHREGVLGTTRDYPTVDPKYDEDLTRLEEVYLGEGSNFWVVEAPDGLVGMAAISRIDGGTGRLRRMRVTKSWRRKGVAKALLDEAISFCRACGYGRLILDTTEHQTAAQRMYESAGFVRLGQRSLGPFVIYDYALELT